VYRHIKTASPLDKRHSWYLLIEITDSILALQLQFPGTSESMGNHDSEPDDWWRVD
jgi:hypothetical protein